MRRLKPVLLPAVAGVGGARLRIADLEVASGMCASAIRALGLTEVVGEMLVGGGSRVGTRDVPLFNLRVMESSVGVERSLGGV